MLRYGVSVKEELGLPKETGWFIDWKDSEKNHFAVKEEVMLVSKYTERPDVVIYVNGAALGVIELKPSKVGVEERIRQNPAFIEKHSPSYNW